MKTKYAEFLKRAKKDMPFRGVDFAHSRLLVHSANVLPQALEALKKAEKLIGDTIKSKQAELKDADPQSQFYGEDIVSPPIYWSIQSTIAAIENVEV